MPGWHLVRMANFMARPALMPFPTLYFHQGWAQFSAFTKTDSRGFIDLAQCFPRKANPWMEPALARRLFQDRAAIFYGTTYNGGSNGYANAGLGYGIVFKTDTNGAFTELHSFMGPDGANPTALTLANDGNLYGVASHGGASTNVVDTNGDIGFGVIFKIAPGGTLTTLYSFGTVTDGNGNPLDGALPNSLVQGSNGVFYGTTAFGGVRTNKVDAQGDVGYGTIFQITTNGIFTSLYSFGTATNSVGVSLDGAQPVGPLAHGADGNFYGETEYGGATNTGTIFRVTTNGLLTTLFTFGQTNQVGFPLTGGTGTYPRGGLLPGVDGYMYGTTSAGGPSPADDGTLFRIGPPAPSIFAAPPNLTLVAGSTNSYVVSVTSLYTASYQWQFDGTNLNDGGEISGSATTNLVLTGVMLADTGTYTIIASNAAGTAKASGVLTVVPALFMTQPAGATIPAGATNIFSVSVKSILPVTYQWQFNGTNLTDGGEISGSATSTLTLSGVTLSDSGTYSVIVSNAAGAVTSSGAMLSVLPFVTTAQTGNLVLVAGSTVNFDLSAYSIYPLTYQWQYNGTNLTDGGNISGSTTSNLTITAATMGQSGTYSVIVSNVAGTVTNSGAILTVVPFIVVALPSNLTDLAGSTATFNLALQSVYPMSYQWQFNGANLSDGGNISGSITSNLTVTLANTTNSGTYSIIASNAAGWSNWNAALTVITPTKTGCKYTPLYSFSGSADGANPKAALLQASNGDFYGTTYGGGIYGGGTVFSFSSNGTLSTLYPFGASASDGSSPMAALTQGADGNFYGTTEFGGGSGSQGVVFSMTPSGNLTNLVAFGDGSGLLQAALVQDGAGIFYCGTVEGYLFQITASGVYTPIHLLPTYEGAAATLLLATDGNFYGVTFDGGAGSTGGASGYGSIFKVSTNGTFATLYSFSGGTDGANPDAPLVQGFDGALYGTATSGGAHGDGTVFRITTNGTLSVLYAFGTETNWDGSSLDGAQPYGLIQGNDGNFYGVTFWAGYSNDGTVFEITTNGVLTTLVYFDGDNGANPWGGLIQGSDGSFYGTTQNGGTNNAGTIFELAVPAPPLVIQPIALTGGNFTFVWSSLAGQSYQVQWTSSLNPPVWLNLGSPIVAAGPKAGCTDSVSDSPRFYRVVQISGP